MTATDAAMGRVMGVAFVAGTAMVQGLATLDGVVGFACLSALGALAAWRAARRAGRPWRVCRKLALPVLAASLGVASAAGQALWRLADAVDPARHNRVARVEARVAQLAQGDAGLRRFVARLPDDRPAGLPARLLVTWRALPGQALPEVVPGQRWRMALRVRRPHANQNPHAPDSEARLLARGVRGLASVRGRPLLLDDDPWADAGIAIERARHRVRAGMRQALAGLRYAPVLVALAIGDQAGVAREDWQVFQRSGIMHLVSISGMHVTAVAALGGWLAGWLWRRARWRGVPLAERAPAQRVAVLAALGPALAYCLLAGWSVPTRRAFFMLAAVAAAVALRWPATPSRLLTLAAVAVAVLDPWAPLAPGFWLSFGAVAVLVGTGAGARPRGMRARLRAALLGFGRTQMAVTLALTPLLAFLVRQVSLGSPLANALAIPVVSLAVTPLALLCGALSALPGGQGPAWLAGAAGHGLFALLMAPVGWIGRAEWSGLDVAAAPWPWLALALAGAAWALQAPGWPARHCGWLCMLPLLAWRPERPPPGYWTLTALDVGQGGAVVLETARHVLLFDTGPRHGDASDAGERVIAPFLRARGYRHIDTLVVSHADLDHTGGLRSVLAALPVGQAYASFDLAAWLARQARVRPDGWRAAPRMPPATRGCEAGVQWRVDGVRLRFVYPPPLAASLPWRSSNARSCVLLVEGVGHRALLTGDVGLVQEAAFAAALPPVDLVMAPHHGSAMSSGSLLAAATRPAHAIAQAGYLNRFGHPAASAINRWRRAGAAVWRTDLDGAVRADSTPRGLFASGQRQVARRYWRDSRAGPDAPLR
ncbi:DNA internalization-related competence protein ComEC/Rec2 [Bordetella bronchiseptica]|nr:DNA internalization-related competence protein ComEC/Rec2 [Bordetella bronchiseptica]AWP75620.1 DNA internalization-related competence protein ComEC/Rec2 [Bordetella bronchiseptica]AZW13138.1 DNA internalization-related competence protein ComEC/Rec2 [Bordetella bronchiseptica]AZW22394.1 DNA internalization-related competence protein ComEC/Rec2 [Bordetella bronchiseptica]QBS69725.1 DNA internalization-related competence protein ComEC/Rec2 [Bordetella bronchiseptica]RFT69087.1 DNA internaliza